MLIPLFLPASLFNFNLFPSCHQCCLSLVAAMTIYQDMLGFFCLVVGFFLVYKIPIGKKNINTRARSYMKVTVREK